jgi:acetyltransferase-like isoleucine patch superfamily enzyme
VGTPRAPLLEKVLRDPSAAWKVARALARGWLCKISHRLRGIRLEVGRDFRVYGRLVARGPGRIVIGSHVRIAMNVTPWTYHPEALIEIGDGTFVNGTRFGCAQLIKIGPRCILAEAQIMDTDFHSIQADRHDPSARVRVESVTLEENVWLCAQAGVLPGTTIGRDSVVGFGAICVGDYPGGVVIAGNPARVVRSISGNELPGSASRKGRSE